MSDKKIIRKEMSQGIRTSTSFVPSHQVQKLLFLRSILKMSKIINHTRNMKQNAYEAYTLKSICIACIVLELF